MKVNLDLKIDHLSRIEGHGNIRIKVKNGKVVEARWDVVEPPRFFEVMLKGKHYTSAGILTARICGICSIGHCLASIRATEQAFGVTVPPAAARLRLLAKHGETLQSHWLHLFFLAAPDFLEVPSVLPLLESDPGVIHLARRLRGLGNHLSETVAGRTTHPVSLQVGGVSAMPARDKLMALHDDLLLSLEEIHTAVLLCAGFAIPAFTRETEFVSLRGDADYPWIGGDMISTDGVKRPEEEYRAMTNEYLDSRNTSKWCRLSRPSFAVGALARCNNNFHLLHPEAVAAAKHFGLAPVCHNPFMNSIAQLIECIHVTHDAIRLIEELLQDHSAPTMTRVIPRAGIGVGAVEVPRGILYHSYCYDRDGYVVSADCVIPTTQNNANIHLDLSPLVQQSAASGLTDEELARLCAMLVRAYDPCVSCSVH